MARPGHTHLCCWSRALTWRERLWPRDTTRDLPWPIPYEIGRQWARRRYLRSIGERVTTVEDVIRATLISLGLVLLLWTAVHLWQWSHR